MSGLKQKFLTWNTSIIRLVFCLLFTFSVYFAVCQSPGPRNKGNNKNNYSQPSVPTVAQITEQQAAAQVKADIAKLASIIAQAQSDLEASKLAVNVRNATVQSAQKDADRLAEQADNELALLKPEALRLQAEADAHNAKYAGKLLQVPEPYNTVQAELHRIEADIDRVNAAADVISERYKGPYKAALSILSQRQQEYQEAINVRDSLNKSLSKLTQQFQDAERIASLPDKYKKYMWEADHIVVPPPSWEAILEQQVTEVRIGQEGGKYLMLSNNILVDAFDILVSPKTPQQAVLSVGFKVLVTIAKSTIAAQDKAQIIVFKNNATYEHVLDLLKDKTRGPQFIAALRSIKEKKAPPSGISEEVMKLARLSQNSNSGFSDIHFVVSAMLSKEAKGAFFETAKMEGIEMLNSKITEIASTSVQNRFKALRDANEQIEIGQRYIEENRTTNPWMTQNFEKRIERIENQMKSFKEIPEAISDFLDRFDEFKKIK